MTIQQNNFILFWSSSLDVVTGQAIVSKRVFDKINPNNWIKLIYPSGVRFIYVYASNIVRLYYFVFVGKIKTAYIVPSRSLFGFIRDIPVLLISLFGVRTILHIHGDGLNELFKKKYIGCLASFLYARSEIIIPCKHLVVFPIRPKNIFIVENYSTIPKHYNPKSFYSDEVKILWNSNVMATKGVNILVDGLLCASKYKINFKLTIMGKPLGDSLMNQLEIDSYSDYLKEETWINYLGAVSPNKVSNIMREHDIVALLSINECQPMVIIEAMCCGLKLIVSDIPGIRNTIGDYPAYFVKRNKDSVAKAFLHACHDLPVDESFRRDAIKRFSSSRFDNQMKEILYLNR